MIQDDHIAAFAGTLADAGREVLLDGVPILAIVPDPDAVVFERDERGVLTAEGTRSITVGNTIQAEAAATCRVDGVDYRVTATRPEGLAARTIELQTP